MYLIISISLNSSIKLSSSHLIFFFLKLSICMNHLSLLFHHFYSLYMTDHFLPFVRCFYDKWELQNELFFLSITRDCTCETCSENCFCVVLPFWSTPSIIPTPPCSPSLPSHPLIHWKDEKNTPTFRKSSSLGLPILYLWHPQEKPEF